MTALGRKGDTETFLLFISVFWEKNYTDSEENTPFLLWQVERSQERVGMRVYWPLRQPDGAIITTGQVTKEVQWVGESLHLQSITKESSNSAGAPSEACRSAPRFCAVGGCPAWQSNMTLALTLLPQLIVLLPAYTNNLWTQEGWRFGSQ